MTPRPLPLTEFPPDRLQLANGDHHRTGPPLHWVHREGGDWVLEAGDFGTPFPLGVLRIPFDPEAFPWGSLWSWLKNITHIPGGVYWVSRRAHLARFCRGCCPMFPWVGHRACRAGFGHSLCGLHPRPHPVLSHPDPGFSEGEGLPLSLHPAVPHPFHRSHGNRLESVPLPHPPLQDLLLPEPPVPLLSVSTPHSPLTDDTWLLTFVLSVAGSAGPHTWKTPRQGSNRVRSHCQSISP